MYYLNKIKQHFYNWYNFGKEHLIGILFFIFLISFFILCIFKLNVVNEFDENGILINQTIFIANITINNWSTWFSIPALGCTLIWALYQYNKNKNIKQQEKSSEIAKEFSHHLMEKLSIISSVLSSDEDIINILKSINPNELSRFDVFEILKISNNPRIFIEYNEILYSKKIQEKYENQLKKYYGKKKDSRFPVNFWLLVQTTLNELEYLCMNISSTAADSKYIYVSLHQIFLPTIHILSPHIAHKNKDNIDKYYINIIEVYNIWILKKSIDTQLFFKTKNKIEKIEIKKQKNINKLLDKKPRKV